MDVNRIINKLNIEWSGDMSNAKRRIAILSAENERLKAEIKKLKEENEKCNSKSEASTPDTKKAK
ncbi:hypothetical protein ACDX78_02120 [Virgibacillus oceani]